MRLTIIIRHFYPFTRPSGVISLTRELILELKRRGVALTVLCIHKKGEKDKYLYQGIKTLKFNQFDLLSYQRQLQRSDPQKVLFISSVSHGMMLPLWWWLLARFSQGFDLYFYQTTNILKPYYPTIWKKKLSTFNKVFVTNDALYINFANNLNLNFKVRKIYPGVNYLELNNRRLGPHKCIKNIGFFGHLSHIKGADNFVKLAATLPKYHFYLVAGKSGDNLEDKRLYLQLLREITTIKNLQYIGFIERPLDIMRQCDLLVLPYRQGGTILGVAQSALEAMAMGIPVIGSQNSALEPLIKNEMNGFFCNENQEIVDKIKLLDANPDLYQRLSHCARETIERQFTIETMTNQILSELL